MVLNIGVEGSLPWGLDSMTRLGKQQITHLTVRETSVSWHQWDPIEGPQTIMFCTIILGVLRGPSIMQRDNILSDLFTPSYLY